MKYLIIFTIALISGCASISSSEKTILQNIQAAIVGLTPAAETAIDVGLTATGSAPAALLNETLIAPAATSIENDLTKDIDSITTSPSPPKPGATIK